MSLPENEKNNFNAESAEESVFAESLVGAAREMYESENPNPNRRGCFSSELLTKMASPVKLPDDASMNHIFECSECFREYRQALNAAKKSVETEKKSVWQSAFGFQRFRLAFAGAGVVAIAGIIIFAFWFVREKPSNELAKTIETANESKPFETPENKNPNGQNQAVRNISPSDSPTETNRATSDRKANDAPPKNRQMLEEKKTNGETKTADNKTATLILILSGDNILRDATRPNTDRRLVLPARRVNLNIKLPDGFSDGNYKIRLTDSFDKTLQEQNATAKNNKLSVPNFNLKNLKNKADKLCLHRDDEIPDCFDIKVAK